MLALHFTKHHPLAKHIPQRHAMSTATLSAQNATSDPTPAVPSLPRPRTVQQLLRIAMHDSDMWVVEMEYADSKGKRTRRTISPIRFAAPDRILGLCLCREEPRQFHLSRCKNFRLIPADEVIMPVPMIELVVGDSLT